MKNKFVKVIVLALIFAGVIAAVIFFNKDEKQVEVYAEWSEAVLPVVYMNFEGESINCLHGYTIQMDKSYMRDSITPVSSDRNISFMIDTYEGAISGISYQVWSLDGEKLYVKKECKDYVISEDCIKANIKLEDIFYEATEYQLVIILETKEYKEINYYTRIRYYEDTNIGELLDFAKQFSTQALEGSLSNEMLYQLESDDSSENNTFGYVDIRSSYSHIEWEELSPQLASDVNVTIKDFNETIGSILLEYAVTAKNEAGGTVTFDVKEFICVQYVNLNYYLIAYERQAEQRFRFNANSVQYDKIELGVISKDNLPVDIFVSNAYNIFAAGGDLWCYDSNNNSALRLFSFKEVSDDVRTLFDKHDYKVVSVDKDGNIQFTVSGYMNSGLHEGMCGIGFYKYTKESNTLNELFFIQSEKPYEVLKEEVGALSYMGENGMFYMTYGNSLYAVDFDGPEYVRMTNRLIDNMYAVDEANGMAAWQEQDDWSMCTSIREALLDDDTEYAVEAEEGEYLRLLGFIDGDMIIGRVREADIVREGSLVVEYPMYKLEIINREHEIETEYKGNGLYISDVETGDERIVIKRLQRVDDGSFIIAKDDVLLKNWETEAPEGKIVSDVLEKRKLVYSLQMASIPKPKQFSIINPELPGSITGLLSLASSDSSKDDVRYYAYSAGKLQGITDSVKDAINLVYDNMGVVVDARMNYVWTRANRSPKKQLLISSDSHADAEADTIAACLNVILDMEGRKSNAAKEMAKGKSAYDVLNDALDKKALDLKGCLLNQVLYYVNEGSPVIAYTSTDKAELIIGYTGTTQIVMYDTMTQSTYELTWQEAVDMFEAAGNVFLSYKE